MLKKSSINTTPQKTFVSEPEVKKENVVAKQPVVEEQKARPGSFAALISQ